MSDDKGPPPPSNPPRSGTVLSPDEQRRYWDDQRQFWEDQRHYWSQDLAYKKQSFHIARTSFIVSVFGFGIVSCALFLNWHQSRIVGKNLRNSVQQSMVKLTSDLDKIYIDHPELRQYIYTGVKPAQWTQTNDEQAAAAA